MSILSIFQTGVPTRPMKHKGETVLFQRLPPTSKRPWTFKDMGACKICTSKTQCSDCLWWNAATEVGYFLKKDYFITVDFYLCVFKSLKPGFCSLRHYLNDPGWEVSPLYLSQEGIRWLSVTTCHIGKILVHIMKLTIPKLRNFKNVSYQNVWVLGLFNTPWVRSPPNWSIPK